MEEVPMPSFLTSLGLHAINVRSSFKAMMFPASCQKFHVAFCHSKPLKGRRILLSHKCLLLSPRAYQQDGVPHNRPDPQVSNACILREISQNPRNNYSTSFGMGSHFVVIGHRRDWKAIERGPRDSIVIFDFKNVPYTSRLLKFNSHPLGVAKRTSSWHSDVRAAGSNPLIPISRFHCQPPSQKQCARSFH